MIPGEEPESPAPYAMSSAAMKAVFNNLTLGAGRRTELEYGTNSPIHDEADSIEVNVKSARVNSQMHVTDWAEAQWEDLEIEAAMDWCQLDKKKSELWAQQLSKLKSQFGLNRNTPAGKSLLRNADWLTLSGGLLYHRYTPKYQVDKIKCFMLPKAHRQTAIDGCHRDMGHQGKKRTESLVSDGFWWPGVHEDIDQVVQNCKQCQLYGGKEEKAPMVPMMVTAPLKLVHLDFTSFEITTDLNEMPKVKSVLVIMDHFMRYTRAHVTKDQKAPTAAKILYEEFISIFGVPREGLHEQGGRTTLLPVWDQPVNNYSISPSRQ